MIWFADIIHKEKCTVIESLQGEVKLIKRSYRSGASLVTIPFHNLKDCLEYAEKKRFQINILYSGRRNEKDRNKVISENEFP